MNDSLTHAFLSLTAFLLPLFISACLDNDLIADGRPLSSLGYALVFFAHVLDLPQLTDFDMVQACLSITLRVRTHSYLLFPSRFLSPLLVPGCNAHDD